jgi:transmembrane sensor
MEHHVKDLSELGARLRQAQEDGLAEGHDLSRVRDRFLGSARPVRRATWAALAAAAMLSVVAVVLFVRIGPGRIAPAVPAFVIGAGRAGQIGEPVVGGVDANGALRFPDGTTVLLRPDAVGQVLAVSDVGARVVLTRGEAVVSVVHKAQAKWTFEAGPFRVAVTGTQFDLGWDAPAGRFWIQMKYGSVLVSGPGIQGDRPVSDGQRLELNVAEPAPPSASAAEAEPGVGPAAPAAPSAARTVAPPRRSAIWQDLADQGDFSKAIESAEAEGYESLIERLNATDLMALSNAARYANSAGRAKQAYGAIRRRFPKAPEAAVAAFHLGRFAPPGPESAEWFETYLREQPNGSLRREALGRLLESRAHGSDTARAADVARRYLAEYPEGPHAGLARRLLQ